ncbi:M16 family metallopeptidase [Fulvivirga lutimaris]|uniref:M16 family metallopeptidase n=1 Tax=Fulvivirga lutimaris TaxID=1819566 RepID=UPI0012BCF161|nr:pitrilysin family protein [Fulvivirga lutimaris]MTI38541.1 insulinase family protein [Fulvivirga lutimaris]
MIRIKEKKTQLLINMLDRKTPPVHFQFPDISIPEPQTSYLENGLPIHIFNSTSQPVVKLEIILRNAGSKTDLNIGTSFLISKTLQSGTKSYTAQEITNQLAEKGAFLEVNSSFDYSIVTVYSLTKHLQSLLPLIYEIIYLPKFPKTEIELQKRILISGLKTQNKKTSVIASKNFRQSVLGSNNPYGKIITESSLDSLTASELSVAHENYTSNIEIIINGNISSDLKMGIEKYFGSTAYSPNFTTPLNLDGHPNQEGLVSHYPLENSIQTSIRIGKRTLLKSDPEYHHLLITNHLLGGYFGSRLMSNIREEKGLTYGIYSNIVSFNDAAYFVIGSDVNGKDKELAIEEITKEIDKLKSGLIFSDELLLVKNHLLGSFQSDLSSPLSLSDKFKSIHLSGLTYQYYYNYLDVIKQISEQDIIDISSKYLNSNNLYGITAGA